KDGGLPGVGLPAPHSDVDIGRIDLERARLATCPFGCNQEATTFVSGILRSQRHSGTAARQQCADRHKTVARLPNVAGVASQWSSRPPQAARALIPFSAAPLFGAPPPGTPA